MAQIRGSVTRNAPYHAWNDVLVLVWGLSVIALGALGPLVAVRLPLGGYRPLRLSDLMHDAVLYEWVLFALPPLAGFTCVLAGAARLLLRRARSWTVWPVVQLVAGFLALIAGARWVGFYLARHLDPGVDLIRLEYGAWAPPLLGLALIIFLKPWSRWFREPRPWLGAASFMFLIAFAAFPYATREVEGSRLHLDELTLALARSDPYGVASRWLLAARIGLWGLGLMGAARLAASSPRLEAMLGGALWAELGLSLGVLVSGTMFEISLATGGSSIGPNWAPALAGPTLLGLWIIGLRGVRQGRPSRSRDHKRETT